MMCFRIQNAHRERTLVILIDLIVTARRIRARNMKQIVKTCRLVVTVFVIEVTNVTLTKKMMMVMADA